MDRSYSGDEAGAGQAYKPVLITGQSPIRAELSAWQQETNIPDSVRLGSGRRGWVSHGSDRVRGPHQSPAGREPSKVKENGGRAGDMIPAYGRSLGHGSRVDDPWALIEFPFEVVTNELGGGFSSWISALRIRIEDGTPAVFPIKALCQFFPPGSPPHYRKPELSRIARFFRGGGIALEPDPTLGGANPSKSGFWAAFPFTKNGRQEPGPAFEAASTVLHLATAVAHTDESVETSEAQALAAHMKSGLNLPAAQQRRLDAHLRWLLAAPPNLSGVKDRISALSVESRTVVSKVVLAVASADGSVFPDEVRIITKIFDLLGIPQEELRAQLRVLASFAPPPRRPVPVQGAAPPKALPKPPAPGESEPGTSEVARDPVRQAEIRRKAREASDDPREVFEELVTLYG